MKGVLKRKDYQFRKGGFAIIVIAFCDIDGRFITATAKHCGGTTDTIAGFQAFQVPRD
jgi:hypothetical protein